VIDALGVDMPKLLHGEQDMTFHRPIRVGDVVYQQIALVEVTEKPTKAMGPADFFRVWITLRDADGELLAEAYQSFFVRDDS
jgi:acyl dehydratase